MFSTLFTTTIIMDAKEEVSMKSVTVHTCRTFGLVDGSDTLRLSPMRQLFMCDVKPKGNNLINVCILPKLGYAHTAKHVFPQTVDLLPNLTRWLCCL